MTRLIRSEFLKIRTTHIWWILALSALVMAALAFTLHGVETHSRLHPTPPDFPPNFPADQAEQIRQQAAEDAARARTPAGLATAASQIYTSGQYFGLLFVMLLGILMITNEYRHQTVTATFLVTPQRTRVVLAKLITAMGAGLVLWVVTTAITVGAGVVFFSTEHVSNSLSRWDVQRSIALNLLAYALWVILGIGIGALIRSQIGATVTATVLYLVGTQAAAGIVLALYFWLKLKWIAQALLFIPSFASGYMVGGEQNAIDEIRLWPRWAAALILIGYGLLSGGLGTLILRKRDVS